MRQVEDLFDTQSLQIEQCKQWIRQRFISELEAEELSPNWALAWSIALSQIGIEIAETAVKRLIEGGKP